MSSGSPIRPSGTSWPAASISASVIPPRGWAVFVRPGAMALTVIRWGAIARGKIPALLTSTSRRPKRSVAAPTIERAWLATDTSTSTASARPPSASTRRAVSAAPTTLTSAATIEAPSWANARASARPMPCPAPVTITTLPVKSVCMRCSAARSVELAEAARIPHPRPDVGLHVAQDLFDVVAVVMEPLVQQVANRQLADVRMLARALKLGRRQACDEPNAVLAHGFELAQDVEAGSLVVVTLPSHAGLVPGLESGLVLLEDRSDATVESASLRLHDVAEHFVDAPLVLGGPRAAKLVAEALDLSPDRDRLRAQKGGDSFDIRNQPDARLRSCERGLHLQPAPDERLVGEDGSHFDASEHVAIEHRIESVGGRGGGRWARCHRSARSGRAAAAGS